ncbi:MAG: hypothetical protein K8L99_33795 [Anaerolineae bacterium]|nr:hypothetical protein [Anaerolineae bacterium]
MSYKGKINQYTCTVCGGVITTIDRDEGTTAFFVSCYATPECQGPMRSSMYQVDQSLVPDHEWYKPTGKIQNRALREHVRMGGLLIRPIRNDGKPKPPEPRPAENPPGGIDR